MQKREEYILNELINKGKVNTSELAENLGVSKVTIRNDLTKLDEEGKLVKTHGGATAIDNLSSVITYFQYRESQNHNKKKQIVKRALRHIHDGQTIMLDASSTCLLLAHELHQFNRLTVVTNGIYTMLALKDLPNITTIFIGGIVTPNSGSTEGTLGKDLLKAINVDVAFTSSHSISLEGGLADFNFYEVQLKKIMLKRANKIVALIDSTKFGKGSVASFADLDSLDEIITDCEIDDRTLETFRNHHPNIIKCVEPFSNRHQESK